MALTAGTRLGPYEIQTALGVGGMGEVYKARDIRLDRIVAIKVLPPEWSAAPAMKQRFDREAQVIASLNHPNICKLHDVGRATEDIAYLVMEFLEGETLADRLARGAIPVEEAIDIAIAIGDALDKAHRQGVVHRDLKPANIMLTGTGPKLLDFGLARWSSAPPKSHQDAVPTTPITQVGALLGTLEYMAPEQLDGLEADARTDIFALGVVLHEMITGTRAFQGKTQVLLISAIATAEPPPLSRVQPSAPPALDHLVRTCLAKDPDDRWQAMRDIVAELRWIANGGGASDESVPVKADRRGRAEGSRLVRIALIGAAVVALGLAVPASLYLRGEPEPERLELRVATMPVTYVGSPQVGGVLALSPNGREIVLRGRREATTDSLWVSTFDFANPRQLPGTEDATLPFWSADGRSIAFHLNDKLLRIDVAGGRPLPVCDVRNFRGGTWNQDGTIVFGSAEGLFSVRAEGGKPVPLTTVSGSEIGHAWPRFLPDGRRYLYLSWSSVASERAIMAGVLGSMDKTRILPADSNTVYAVPGYLVFRRETSLYAQPFDAGTLKLSGEATLVADSVSVNTNGRSIFDVSANGVLAYYRDTPLTTTARGAAAIGDEDQREWQLAWVDRLGQNPTHVGKPGVYRGADVSPDGSRIAVHRHDAKGGDVWILEPNGTETRITSNASQDNSNPVWSHDGLRVTYTSLRNGKWGLYQTASDGTGREEPILESEQPKAPSQWSPDGQYLLYWVRDPKTSDDLWIWSVAEKKSRPLVVTEARERHGQISHDGKWIAYASTPPAGRSEIFVRPFPAGTGEWQVSPSANDGGAWPRWSRKTGELLYRTRGEGPTFNTRELWSAKWTVKGSAFTPEAPQAVVRINGLSFPHNGGDYHTFGVSPDGQRLLIFQRVLTADTGGLSDADPIAGITVLMNWTKALKK